MPNMNLIPNSREPQLLPINIVKPYPRHARRHSEAKIGKLKKLLGQFGQVAPILVDGDNVIISGHALHKAMRELGAGEIAAISIAGRSESEIKALRLALNRLPLEAAWDDNNLRAELQALVELSFDLDLTGFDPPEIDSLLDLDLPKNNIAEDDAEIPPIGEVAISAKGDIWVCGRHRLGCGDALDQGFVDKIRGSAQADVLLHRPALQCTDCGLCVRQRAY
jgi:ParB-like chromosome segregation protein Spo0J